MLKNSVIFGLGVVFGYGMHKLTKAGQKPKAIRSDEDEEDICEAIFFPDRLLMEKAENRSKNERGPMMYKELLYETGMQEEASLFRLVTYLKSAKRSIDLCMFVINSHQLADAVIGSIDVKGDNKFKVRLIIDESCNESSGSAVPKFRRAGAFVRFKRMEYLMHHKFVIIDDKILISGSFNWTMQAMLGNKENVIVTSNQKLVERFRGEFSKLLERI